MFTNFLFLSLFVVLDVFCFISTFRQMSWVSHGQCCVLSNWLRRTAAYLRRSAAGCWQMVESDPWSHLLRWQPRRSFRLRSGSRPSEIWRQITTELKKLIDLVKVLRSVRHGKADVIVSSCSPTRVFGTDRHTSVVDWRETVTSPGAVHGWSRWRDLHWVDYAVYLAGAV